ncbi:MAG TPA: ferredoxin [Acidimicrobiales bacterium]|nr:ferredoxin [Acidimicrobiales bacterium]
MGLQVDVDRDVCIGSGNCVYGAPGTFDLDDDGVAFVVDPDAAPEDAIVRAAQRCPSRAITVRRDGVSLI